MLIGLTGGIGCGKSTVLEIFSKLGWHTIDADSICHQIYENAESNLKEILKKRWGEKILTTEGLIDRKSIADIVFRNKEELEWLNSVMHPEIIRRAKKLQAESKMPVIFDAPLLYEAQIENEFDAIIAVWCNASLQKARLLARGLNITEIEARIAVQLPAEKKLERADFAIINNGDFDCLQKQCEKLHFKITNKIWKRSK